MSDAPLVTVVIPTYNHARLLAHALQSVRTQTFTNWEAVVVNNYSADDTVAVVEACADPRIRLENFRNNGVIAASRNRGISLARGKYIAFLDSDDVWYPQKLAKCIERIESGFDMVCHAVVQIEGARRRNVFCGPERAATFDALISRGNCIVNSAAMVRKDVIESVGRLSEDMATVTSEDYHLWLKLAKINARSSFLREVLGEYHVHPGGQSAAALRHLASVLHVLNEFVPPQAPRPLAFQLRARRGICLAYYGAARGLQRSGEYARAWTLLFRSVTAWPFMARAYAAMALNAVGQLQQKVAYGTHGDAR